jgi:hypothetical protein
MDVRMPGLDGIEATRKLTSDGEARTRVLMLTTFDLDEYVYDALAAGASGFLLKDVTAEHLFEAVRIVAAGEALLAPAVTRRLIDEFARLRPQLPVDPERLSELTPRETEVLRLVSEGLSTPRSPNAWSSPRRPSRRTSAASSGSSTFATGARPSSWPTRPGSSSPTQAPESLHPHRVVPRVDVERRPGHVLRFVRE